MPNYIRRHSLQAQAIALLDALAFDGQVPKGTKANSQLLRQLQALAKPNDALFHGKRVEAMFAFVAASLGKCALIREEDVGDVFSTTPVQTPDYRIVLTDGAQLLVEVKNCHEARKPLKLKADYLTRLASYATLTGCAVKLAIYWSRWSTWTLVPLDALRITNGKGAIAFPDAVQANEMAIFGDHMMATRPPLAIRLMTDPTKPRKAARGGSNLEFTIGGVELYCGGHRVTDPLEKRIVNHFMLFGRWPQETNLEIQNGELLWVEFLAGPVGDEHEEQGFSIVGDASAMIARHFDFRTVSMSGEIQRLRPLADPSKVGIDIPVDYKGRDVPLWRFVLQPRSIGPH